MIINPSFKAMVDRIVDGIGDRAVENIVFLPSRIQLTRKRQKLSGNHGFVDSRDKGFFMLILGG